MAGIEDAGVLRQMLAWAAGWRHTQLDESSVLDPGIALYVEGWGRLGDAGVIAENEDGIPIGAAWYRHFTPAEHGYGFLAPEVPEVSVGVSPGHRGRRVGTALLEALVEQAEREGVLALSLSVEESNPAARLYERLGFRRIARVGGAWTMRRELR